MTENTAPTSVAADVHDTPATSASAKCQCTRLLKELAGKPLHIRIIAWYMGACALFWVLGWLFRGDPGYTVIAVLARPASLLLVMAAVVLTVMAGFLAIAERLPEDVRRVTVITSAFSTIAAVATMRRDDLPVTMLPSGSCIAETTTFSYLSGF